MTPSIGALGGEHFGPLLKQRRSKCNGSADFQESLMAKVELEVNMILKMKTYHVVKYQIFM